MSFACDWFRDCHVTQFGDERRDFLGFLWIIFLILLGKFWKEAPFSPKLWCVDMRTTSVRKKED